jgi:hypothetical protein
MNGSTTRSRRAARGPRHIAPRLANGERRESFGHGLPPEIKAGLRKIADAENRSMSWVMEEVTIRYFKLPAPEYVAAKTPPAPIRRSRLNGKVTQ